MDKMKSERFEDLKRFKHELEILKNESHKLEGEIKKQKLVANNYQEKLKSCTSGAVEIEKKRNRATKKLKTAEDKELEVRNSLLQLKTVYQVKI